MKKAGYLVFTVLALAFVAELGLGIIFWFEDSSQQLILLEDTKDAPYTYYSFAQTEENDRNADGFHFSGTVEKPANTYRVALIGGSVAEFLGEAKDHRGNTLLQTELRNALGYDNIEVVPAGMSGYVIEQEFILTQLILQKYKPDLVVGLDGYNDLMSFKINRFRNENVLLPPQNYGEFKVIADRKRQDNFSSRFAPLFRNIWRAAWFVERYASDESQYDFSSMTEEDYTAYTNAFAQIVEDTHDFCSIKGINYFCCIQPVRYYDSSAESLLTSDEEDPAMASMYNSFEKKVLSLGYSATLTHIFDGNRDVYLDPCHVNREGNEILAREIATALTPVIARDSAYIKLNSSNP